MESGGTFRKTTDPAPIRQFSPTVILPRILAPPTNYDFVFDGGVPLALLFPGSSERDALIHRDVVAHNCSLAYYDAQAVIDKKPPPYRSARMDFDPREKPCYL